MTRVRFGRFLCMLVLAVLLAAQWQCTKTKPSPDWPVYGGNSQNTHYSPLTQINKSNVKRLEVAWSYDTGETGGLQRPVHCGRPPARNVARVSRRHSRLRRSEWQAALEFPHHSPSWRIRL